MVEVALNLGLGGGDIYFDELNLVRRFASSQRSEWDSFISQLEPSDLNLIPSNWHQLAYADDQSLKKIADDFSTGQKLVTFSSPLGLHIRNSSMADGVDAWRAHVRQGHAISQTSRIDESMQYSTNMLSNWLNDANASLAAMTEATTEKFAGFQSEMSAILERIETEKLEHTIQLNAVLNEHHNRIKSFVELSNSASAQMAADEAARSARIEALLAEHDSRVQALNAAFDENVTAERDRYDEAAAGWNQLTDAHRSQLRLKAPIELWETRSSIYAYQAKAARFWASIIAPVGLLGAVAVASASFVFARWLLSDATVSVMPPARVAATTATTGAPPVLRATFQYELLLTGALTLFYLTIAIWLLRLIVRNYITAEHLRIDAEARASLTSTYLSLIAEGGVTSEADRAVVLGSIFKPIADGLVKDDGPPALTPAALLAGLVGGKSGTI